MIFLSTLFTQTTLSPHGILRTNCNNARYICHLVMWSTIFGVLRPPLDPHHRQIAQNKIVMFIKKQGFPTQGLVLHMAGELEPWRKKKFFKEYCNSIGGIHVKCTIAPSDAEGEGIMLRRFYPLPPLNGQTAKVHELFTLGSIWG